MKASRDPKLAEDINKFLEAEEELAPGAEGGAEGEAWTGTPEDVAAGQELLGSWDRMIYNEEEEDWEIQLKNAMDEKVPAVILLGESGVGKTTMIDALAKEFLDTPVSYFNAPNMDPFIHLVGIPHVKTDPKTDELVLAFVRKSGIEEAELLVLDEINRVPPSTQNTLFELVATRQINGEKFGKLCMVWGAMNPPRSDIEGRSVQDVEDALRGRFHEVIPVLAKPKMKHYEGRQGIGRYVAEKCLRWWYQEIEHNKERNVQFKDIITPRVLEYMMVKIQKLENRKLGQGTVKQMKRGLTPREWSVEFDSVCQHSQLSRDTKGVSIPFTKLKMSFMGRELYDVMSLTDTSPDVDKNVKEIQDIDKFPEAGKHAAGVIVGAIKGTRLRPTPLISWYRIGQFSKVITAMDVNDASKIITGRPEIAGFLFTKCKGNDVTKREYSKGNMEHEVWKPPTQGELAIYKHLEYFIVRAVKTSAGQKIGLPAAAAGAATSGAPGAPKATPGAGLPPGAPGAPGAGVPPGAAPGARGAHGVSGTKKPGVP